MILVKFKTVTSLDIPKKGEQLMNLCLLLTIHRIELVKWPVGLAKLNKRPIMMDLRRRNLQCVQQDRARCLADLGQAKHSTRFGC